MYVCICNAVTEKQIRRAAKSGVRDLPGLQRELGVGSGCGSCTEMASELLNESKAHTRLSVPRIYQPALA